MFTYLLMGLPFIFVVLLLDWVILRTRVVKRKECWLVMAVLMFLTAVFDQLLTGLPIVTYNEAHILNIKLGSAPIEDFMYSFAGVIGIGSLWTYYDKR